MRPIVALVVAAGLLAGCASPAGEIPTATPSRTSCADAVVEGPLPEWARTGFTPPDQSVPHVVGDRGDIVGVLFGAPLQAPPGVERGNKILWVGRLLDDGPQDLLVQGTSDTGASMEDTVPGGPGPSIIDVPSPGCWTFSLTWGSHGDVVHVPYGPPDS